MRFEAFVALRYLRGKRKNRFISIITLISVAGVAVGVMTLIIVMGVMTGFDNALRDAIIGNRAHLNVLPAFGGQVLDYRAMIAEVERVDINGLSQWTLTRARDLSNPVLLVLHGGPGASEFALFRAYNSALEDHFVVVHWEQRGTGKSFDPDTPVHSMNPEQFIADLDQLVDHLRAKFGRERIALLGHSWGSIMGTIYSARYPQKLSGYIGTGQIADMRANEQVSYEFALAQARQRSHEEAIAELEEIGPPPYSAEKTLQQRHWLSARSRR